MKKKILALCMICLSLAFFSACDKSSPTTPESLPTSNSTPSVSLEIISFIATSQTIKRGTHTTLSWEVKNSTAIEIDQNIGMVEAVGSQRIEPLTNTTYTLKATNNDGAVSRSLAIIVENGADVVMISGPKWKVDPNPNYVGILYKCSGIVKNQGTYKASFVKIYIYLFYTDGTPHLTTRPYTLDKTHLEPKEKASWSTFSYGSPDSNNNYTDFSKTEYEIQWSEYAETFTTGRMRIGEV